MFCFVFGKFILTGVCQRRCRNAFTTWFSANNDSIKCHMCVFFGVFADSSFLWFYLAIPVKSHIAVFCWKVLYSHCLQFCAHFSSNTNHIYLMMISRKSVPGFSCCLCSHCFFFVSLNSLKMCMDEVEWNMSNSNLMWCYVMSTFRFTCIRILYTVSTIHISESGYVEIVNIYINVSMCGSHQSLRVLKWNWPVGFVSCWFIIYLR